MKFLSRFTRSPYLNLIVGLILILISADEVMSSLQDGLDAADINSHMGLTFMGIVHTLKALPDLFEGAEYLQRAKG
ncbi:MAG: hypothetical protein H6R07_3030 [Proteobacteria bacterium]|nr:hypothetical protein [Pseudomonadota bacterium]